MYFILNPRVWPEFMRHLRRSHPASPPMLMIAGCGVIAFSSAVRIWFGPFSILLLTAVSCVSLLLATLVSLTVARDCLRRLIRYRSLAWSRQRWWFESARLALLVGTIAGCSSMSLGVLEPIANLGLLSVAVPLLQLAFLCAAVFVVACTFGIALSQMNRRPRVGRAYECVAFFYQFCLAGIATFVFAMVGLHFQAPEVMLFGLAAGCVLMAVMVQWKNKRVERLE